MDIALSKVDICEICRESVLDFYELLSSKNFQVNIDIPEMPVFVQGNKEALQRILFNLISNVIRYGADGKYLGLSLKNEERNVYVEVTDKGKGIDQMFADSIFDRLFTMEDSRNRKIQGNGLGLTIAKNSSCLSWWGYYFGKYSLCQNDFYNTVEKSLTLRCSKEICNIYSRVLKI